MMVIRFMRELVRNKIVASLNESTSIAPLVVFRMAFGAIMLFSTVRFLLKGWVKDFYITPQFHFTFYGFEWVKPLGETGMYILFAIMVLASLGITLGFFYKLSASAFFLVFSYVELIDKTYYLNHYYFISIISFLMMLVPANRYFSLDVFRKPSIKLTMVPAWTIGIFKLQLFMVYFFAGLSKISFDWLFEAMPLKIWLPANAHLPLIGSLLKQEWVAYLFSWFGLIFDLLIGFLLWNRSTRKTAYLFVIVFHVFTGWFFKIGMFPYIMIALTLVFFSADFHVQLIEKIRNIFNRPSHLPTESETPFLLNISPIRKKIMYTLLLTFFTLQVLIPFRYLFYPGKLYWTEEGYRFSWRVMLMEKGGTAFFYVTDQSGRKTEVINSEFLTPAQERMMSTQPDMILQYAHFLEDEYKKRGLSDPVIKAESYVTLNGSGSRPFIDSTVDLSKEKESFSPKKWILPFHQSKNSK
jgi:hypothetical protein